jgi:hypothetical protein
MQRFDGADAAVRLRREMFRDGLFRAICAAGHLAWASGRITDMLYRHGRTENRSIMTRGRTAAVVRMEF